MIGPREHGRRQGLLNGVNAGGGDPANGTPTNGELYRYYLYITGVMTAPSFRESY